MTKAYFFVNGGYANYFQSDIGAFVANFTRILHLFRDVAKGRATGAMPPP